MACRSENAVVVEGERNFGGGGGFGGRPSFDGPPRYYGMMSISHTCLLAPLQLQEDIPSLKGWVSLFCQYF